MKIEAEKNNLKIAVGTFAYRMTEKLHRKVDQGWHDWDDPAFRQTIREKLACKVAQLIAGDDNQALDVANFAMMLDYTSDLSKDTTAGHEDVFDQAGRILTCVYCGMEYPQGTPSHGAQVLTDHIKVCKEHPMRKCEADRDKLRRALIGLVGAETTEELKKIEASMRAMSGIPEDDRCGGINAIKALLETADPIFRTGSKT